MSQHDLSEIDLREGELRIRLRRGPLGRPIVATSAPVAPTAPVPDQSAAASTPPAAPEAAKPAKNRVAIKSPTPGTFYARPKPDEPPFVQVGSRVTPTTVVCVIEAMK